MKSTLILEEIIEFYIKKYSYLLMLNSKESLKIEDFSNKSREKEEKAKKQIHK